MWSCTETSDILHGVRPTPGWLNILLRWFRKQQTWRHRCRTRSSADYDFLSD